MAYKKTNLEYQLKGEPVTINLGPEIKPIGQLIVHPLSATFIPTEKGGRRYFLQRQTEKLVPLEGFPPEALQMIDTPSILQIMDIQSMQLRPVGLLDHRSSSLLGERAPKVLRTQSLEELITTIFPGNSNLKVLEIGSGYGDFIVEIGQQKNRLGFGQVVASDLHPELMDPILPRMKKLGIQVIKLDATGVADRNLGGQDIVFLNAPQAVGANAYADNAISTALGITKPKGLVLFRLNEACDDIDYEPDRHVDHMIPMVNYRDLAGLPSSIFTNSISGNRASVHAIIKI